MPTSPPLAGPIEGLSHASILIGRTLADLERQHILETLGHCRGNRTHAARMLGISIRTLRNKLNTYSLSGIAVTPP